MLCDAYTHNIQKMSLIPDVSNIQMDRERVSERFSDEKQIELCGAFLYINSDEKRKKVFSYIIIHTKVRGGGPLCENFIFFGNRRKTFCGKLEMVNSPVTSWSDCVRPFDNAVAVIVGQKWKQNFRTGV